jgi:RNA polymerase sigma-70 factor (ECF subfamily)
MSSPPDPGADENLDMIATQWFALGDPDHFVARYAGAIRSYLVALLKNREDADDVAQDFFVRVFEQGLGRVDPSRGRFRDYLKTAVRNAALSHLRRRRRRLQPLFGSELPERAAGTLGERDWLEEWRACLLERAWQALETHERQGSGNLYFTVLRLQAKHPHDDGRTLTSRLARQTGRRLQPEAFRKQLSRARRCFARLVVCEVALTLETSTPQTIRDELAELGLRSYVEPYLRR